MITPLPSLDRTAPTFKADTDTFFAVQLPQFSVEVEAGRAQVVTAQASASASQLSATASAAAAYASQLAAASYATAPQWASGASYAAGIVVFSPITNLLYRCTVAVVGGTVDPSVDTDHWSSALVQGISSGGTGAITAAAARTNLSAAVVATRSNWATQPGAAAQVAGLLGWSNFGNNHVIFDNSKGVAPDGSNVNNGTPQNLWQSNFPHLMGWNGSQTFGVRVDACRTADTAQALNGSNNYVISNQLSFSAAGVGAGFIKSDDAAWGMVLKPSREGSNASFLFATSAGAYLGSIVSDGSIRFGAMYAVNMFATTFFGNLSGAATTAGSASSAVFQTAVAPAGGEAAVVALKANRAQIAMINNDNYAGIYVADYGLLAYLDRTNGTTHFSGRLDGTAYRAEGANYADNAGTVNSLTAYQVGVAVAGIDVFDIGAYMFAFNVSGTNFSLGDTTAGGNLRPANDNGQYTGHVFGGTWKCCGFARETSSTLWKRVV